MNKNLIIIICGLAILIYGLFRGSPFEFLELTVDRIATVITEIIIILLFIYLFKLTKDIQKKTIKWLSVGVIGVLSIPYLLGGIWTTLLITSSYNYPMWQDTAVYTNTDGQKVISQWRETSGSIYDYRNRKIFADFGQFRISTNYQKTNMEGIWTEYHIAKDSTFTIDLNSKTLDY